ncbi:hypothetical protein AV530_005187 [Patagioenas fasciata monilis]|uniref:Uncharacterized protein n=1 Tax=Patagioenas fasciata monilis TaxID=372326 RepID=A0A1V4K496_PATFA|nr:hypothetical protein AV530_005187 [Patagioenas fasciata monilis]
MEAAGSIPFIKTLQMAIYFYDHASPLAPQVRKAEIKTLSSAWAAKQALSGLSCLVGLQIGLGLQAEQHSGYEAGLLPTSPLTAVALVCKCSEENLREEKLSIINIEANKPWHHLATTSKSLQSKEGELDASWSCRLGSR